MSKDNFFSKTGVRNNEITGFSLQRIGRVFDDLEEYRSPEENTITDAIAQFWMEGDFQQFEEDIYINEIDYTLLTCLNNDNSVWIGPMVNTHNETIEADIFRNGYASIWRSIGINDEKLKKKLVLDFIGFIMSENKALSGEPHIELVHNNCTVAIVSNNNYGILSDDDPLLEFLDEGLLFDSDRDRVDTGFRFVGQVGEEYRGDVLFSWLMPLCHRAYLKGKEEKDIIKGASEILDGMAKAYHIHDPEYHDLFKRRCLAHIAMGFPSLMREIGFQKEDLMSLSIIDHDGFMLRDMQYLRLSPLADLSHGDMVSMAYHDAMMLSEFDIEVDIDILMDIENNKDTPSNSLLGPTADFNPSILKEAITHPLWESISHIELSAQYGTKLPIEIQAASLKRVSKGKHYTTMPSATGPWSRAQKKELIEMLVDSESLSMNAIELIKPDSDILIKYQDKLPKGASRYALSQDLGI